MGVLDARKAKKDRGLNKIPTASTSDVAFLLLIFFIVMPMKRPEVGLSMVLPAKSKATSVTVRESNVATIRVLPSNALTLDGELIPLTRVRQAIVERLAGNDQTIVVLETHPDADYGMMIACLDEVKQADARKVSLKTTKR